MFQNEQEKPKYPNMSNIKWWYKIIKNWFRTWWDIAPIENE